MDWKLLTTAIEVGKVALDEKKRNALVSKLKQMMRKNRRIIVFGVSGTGKTQFINSLRGKLSVPTRTLANHTFDYAIDDYPIKFLDTPGHSTLYDRKKAIQEILAEGVEGVINVTSYGYEENPEVELSHIFDEEENVRESFLSANRQGELERLGEWLPWIDQKNVGWLINLVNKADVWWDDVEKVNAYYANGTYAGKFEKIKDFRHVSTLPYCSIIKPYYDVRNSGRFGEIQKGQLICQLIDQLETLIKEADD